MKKGKPRQKGDDGMDTLTQRTTGLFGMQRPKREPIAPSMRRSSPSCKIAQETEQYREALVFLPWMQRLIHFPIFACPGDRSFTGQSS